MGDAGRLGFKIPHVLDVEHFAQARVQELEFLDAAVSSVSAVGRDGAKGEPIPGGLRDQSHAPPRHMRRRTASHKPRRMPVALKNRSQKRPGVGAEHLRSQIAAKAVGGVRQGAATTGGGGGGGGEAGEKIRCRKHRRRPRGLLEMHSPHADEGLGEGAPPRWLETHIWHAKRMHMKEMWGFMLPAKSNRGPRAAAEASLKHCTLQDVTFLRPLELRASARFLVELLSLVMDPLDCRPTHADCVGGFTEASTHLYRANEFPLGCIAPVTVMWSPPAPPDERRKSGAEADMEVGGEGVAEEIRRVWLWVHPAAAKEALREIWKACSLEGAPWVGNIEVGPVAGGLCRLRVQGARSREVLQQVLRPASSRDPATSSLGSSGDAVLQERPPLPASGVHARGNDQKKRGVLLALQGVGDTDKSAGDATGEGGSRGHGGDSPPSLSTGTERLRFEDAARDNASLWETLETPSAIRGTDRRSGGYHPENKQQQQISAGAVLAINALDPRELRPSRSRKNRHSQPEARAPTSATASAPPLFGTGLREPEEGDDLGDVRTVGKIRGSGEAGAGKRGESTIGEPLIAATATATAVGAEAEGKWRPRLAPASPLWDPDSRALSAELAEARPDHVLNEARRRERHARAAAVRDGSDVAAFKAPAKARSAGAAGARGAAMGAAAGAGAAGGAAFGGGGFGGGFAPVLLISSPGAATTTREVGAASSDASCGGGGLSGGGGGGSAGGKTEGGVERKRRVAAASGWDLILSAGWAPVFFNALVMAGARAISLGDADGLALETDEPCFPADFPDTTSGRRHWDAVGRESQAAWSRTRPKHRGFKLPPAPPPSRPPHEHLADNNMPIFAGEMTVAETGEREGGGAGSVLLESTEAAGCRKQWAALFRPDFRSLAGVAAVDTFETGRGEPLLLEEEERGAEGGCFEDHGGDPLAPQLPPSSPPLQAPLPPPGDQPCASDTDSGALRGHKGGDGGTAGKGNSHRETEEDVADREPFAVVRGFHYARAFLPAAGADSGFGAAASPAPAPAPVLPPLQLAFPTLLEVLVKQDKGVPHAGAAIYPASARHHALWAQGRLCGKPWPGFSAASTFSSSPTRHAAPLAPEEDTAGGAEGDAGRVSQGGGAAVAAAPAESSAVGAVTSGGFSFLRGGGTGRAVCEAGALRDALFLSSSHRCGQGEGGREGARGGRGGGRGGGREGEGGGRGGNEGGGGGGGGGSGFGGGLGEEGQPWALVLVGNDARSWFRPAVVTLAA